MLDKLREIELKYERILDETSRPEIVGNQDEFRRLMREQKLLAPIVGKFREYMNNEKQMKEAQLLLEDKEIDADLFELAETEYYVCRDMLAKIQEELKIMLLPRDPNDDKSVIVEIRSGAGGEEAALFAYVLYRMYTMYGESMHYKIEPIYFNETELGGLKEVSFIVDGEGAYSRLKFESGVHRVQRVPETESSGRIHTSTVTVAVLPEAEEVEVEINNADLKIDTIKSSGAGGQHVNKTESAVRILHIPSGIVIECQDERSQHKNKDRAMKLLRTRLYDIKQAEQSEIIAAQRKNQVGTGDRSERIRTYNYPQGRVTDHRISLTLFSLETFLNGDIGEMIDALIGADTAEKLKSENF